MTTLPQDSRPGWTNMKSRSRAFGSDFVCDGVELTHQHGKCQLLGDHLIFLWKVADYGYSENWPGQLEIGVTDQYLVGTNVIHSARVQTVTRGLRWYFEWYPKTISYQKL